MFSWYKYLIVSLVFSHLGFWSGNLFLIAPFPDLCLLVPFQRQLFTADRSRYVVNDFCPRKMTSHWSENLLTIKVPDIQIYLKTTNRGFLNYYETSSNVFVHDGQNRLSFQRQLFTADRSCNVVNDFCSRQMKSYKSANLITVKVPYTKIYLKTTSRGFLNWYETSSTVFST